MAERVANIALEEVRNVANLEENNQRLKQKIELLNSREADVLAALQAAEQVSGKKRKREVENWLKTVDVKRKGFEKLCEKIGQTSAYNIVARQPLAKQVVKEIGEVAELAEQGRFPEGIVLDVVVKESVPLVTVKAKGLTFEQNLEDIWASLRDNNVTSIGIWGMAGVGKTTLAMHLHDKLLEEPKFKNSIYWVTVSQEFNSFKLQSDIAKAMQLCISDEDDEKKRAAILYQALHKKEKFVLILDDVWKQFDVGKIGLPLGKFGCKFLVTSRFRDVCQRIGFQKLVKVNALPESEAWELFREELGQTMLAMDIEGAAKMVAKKCCGLPLGIITMARSMRGVTDIHGWKDALEELNESCMGQDGMNNEVLPILLYSFNRLRNQKLKNCFLYCSLYPEDYSFWKKKLIHMFIAEELMDRRSSRHAEFDQGYSILTELENCCLLIGSPNKKYVKMHDLMREMALWITKDNPRFMVKAGLQLKELPEERDWKEDLDKVSLMQNNIKSIPLGTSPKCPRLATLNLSHNPLGVIPESFFVHICGLKTLDLSLTQITQLPNSISNLENLKALLLEQCASLVSLPSLKNLKELRELNLSYTGIKEVIHGMESLINLKILNIRGTSMQLIPLGALRRLLQLQALFLPMDTTVAIEELEGLEHLEEFEGTFCNIRDFSRFVKCQGKLNFYGIGVRNVNLLAQLTKKWVEFTSCNLKDMGRYDEIMLPRDIMGLTICSCEDIEYVTNVSDEHIQESSWLLLENFKNFLS